MRLCCLCVALIGLLLGGCAAVAPESAAGSSVKAARCFVVTGREFVPEAGVPLWAPTPEEIAACEQALGLALATNQLSLGDYYLRLGGIVRDGRRHLVGTAAQKDTGEAASYVEVAASTIPPEGVVLSKDAGGGAAVIALQPFVIHTDGGGKRYFRFDYEVEGKKLQELRFNALE